MDAAQALADLTEISTQIQAALIADEKGAALASTFADDATAGQVAQSALELLAAAEDTGRDGTVRLTQVLAAMRAGSVFVVRRKTGSPPPSRAPSRRSGSSSMT